MISSISLLFLSHSCFIFYPYLSFLDLMIHHCRPVGFQNFCFRCQYSHDLLLYYLNFLSMLKMDFQESSQIHLYPFFALQEIKYALQPLYGNMLMFSIPFYNQRKEIMSIHLKKKSKLYKVFENNELLDLLFFGFLINDYSSIILIDKITHHTLLGRIRAHTKELAKQFKNSYKDVFELIDIQTKENKVKERLKITKTAKGETKVYIPLRFQAQNFLKQEQIYNVSYSHKLKRHSQMKKTKLVQNYMWNSQFYIISTDKRGSMNTIGHKQQRKLWIYHHYLCEENKKNNSIENMRQLNTSSSDSSNFQSINNNYKPTFSIDTIPIRKEDILHINVPFFLNGNQIFDLRFYELEIINNQGQNRSGKDCELEYLNSWIQCAYDDVKTSELSSEKQGNIESEKKYENLPCLGYILHKWKQLKNEGIFQVSSVKSAGVSKNYRIQLTCIREGWKSNLLGVEFQSVGQDKKIEVSLKKRGCYDDEGSLIWIRKGQIVIVYFMQP